MLGDLRSRVSKFVSTVSVVAMLGGYGATTLVLAPAAHAADQATTDVEAGLNALVPLFDELATVSRFGQPLPGLDLRPGSADGLDVATLFSKTFTDAGGPLGGNYGGASNLDGLASSLNGVAAASIGSGRTVTITASHTSASGVDQLPLTLSFDRADAPTGFAVSAAGFTFNSSGGLHTHLVMNVGMTLNYRSSDRTMWLTSSSGTPSLALTATTTLPTPSAVDASVGILKVQLDGDTTSLTSTDNFAATFSDANNDGRLDVLDASAAPSPEITSPGAAAGLVGIDWASSPASALHAVLHLTADTTGLPGANLGAADATVEIGPLNPATDPITANVTSGGLGPFDAFERLSPKDLADSLAELAQFLSSTQLTQMPDGHGFLNIPLPFMKGSLADVAQVNEGITQFLSSHVEQIPIDPSNPSKTIGKPDFASIQDLISKLNNESGLPGGGTFSVHNVSYDGTAGHEKLSMTITAHRGAGTSQPVDNPPKPTTSDGTGVTYHPTSLEDPHHTYDASYVGRAISAGGLTAAILDVTNSGHTLDLDPAPVTVVGQPVPASYWKGATDAVQNPADGTPYAIAAADPQTGAVQLGNALQNVTGLINANAQLPTASVDPSYTINLPVVLDLSPPTSTGAQTVTNPDGSKVVVDSLPTPAQRLKLHTGGTGADALLTLDVPVTSEVHATATVGFLSVKLDGSLAECTTGTYDTGTHDCGSVGDTHLLEVDLLSPSNAPLADADGNLSLPDFFTHLIAASNSGDDNGNSSATPSPQDVLSASVNGEAHASLTLSVPDAPSFFSSPVTVSVDMADITDPTNVDVTAPDLSQLSGLKDFDISNADPKALFGAILAILGGIDGLSSKLGGSSGPLHDALATPIPLLGSSVKSLIGGSVSGGDGVTYGDDGTSAHNATITIPTQNFSSDDSKALAGRTLTAGTTTGVIASASGHVITLAGPWLNGGAAKPSDGTTFSVADELKGIIDELQANSADSLQQVVELLNQKLGTGSGVSFSLDKSTSPATLDLSVDWKRSYTTTQPVALDLGSFTLAGAQAKGTATFGVDGEVKLALGIPLSTDTLSDPLSQLTVDPSNSLVSVKAHADLGDNTFIEANAGPLAIALGDPSHPNATNLQAKAALGVALSDSTDSSPVSLGDFAGNLGVQLNQGVDPVHCDNAMETGANEHFALCAALPVYVSPDGSTWNLVGGSTPDNSNTIKLRLPQAGGSDGLSDQFDPTGSLADGTTPKLFIPSDLTDAIANAFLDLGSLDDGLLGYLKFAEQSLRLASNDGKLPLIGKDLQQGADFLGHVQDTVNSVIGKSALTNGKLSTVQAVQDKLNDLGTALDNEHLIPGGTADFTINLTCSGALLHKAQNVQATAASPDGTTDTYAYEVVATRGGDGTGDTIPSDASGDVQNVDPASLGDVDFNTVTWDPVTYADGYKILRSHNGGAFELIDTVSGQSTNSYDDKKNSSTPYTAVSAEPQLASCDSSEPGSDVSGITIETNLGQGDLDHPDSSPLSAHVPLSVGVPGLSIHAVDDGAGGNDLSAGIAWSLHLKFGLSRDKGFYVETQSHDPSSPAGKSGPEFQVGLAVDLPAHIEAQLAFINVDLRNHSNSPGHLFKGVFAIDLKDSDSSDTCFNPCAVDESKVLDLATLQDVTDIGDIVKPRLSAEANIDWDLKAGIGSATDSPLPGIGAEFKLHWLWTSDNPDGSVLPDVLEFDNVTIDPGSFLNGVIGKIFKQIADAMKPLQPILDTIQAPIPVLSDLSHLVGGDDVTIASLAEEFNTLAGGPDIAPFIDVLTNINKVVKALTGGNCPNPGDHFCINVGSFKLNTQIATTQENTPDLATNPNYIQDALPGDPLSDLDSDATGGSFTNTSGSGSSQCSDPESPDCTHPGFTFPALEHPSQIFQLILGHDVTLAQFDSGPLSLGFSLTEEFGPVYAPPPVDIVISGSAGVTLHVVAGFDTYGIRKAVEAKKVDAGILDSLYFATTDSSGKPLPVVSFTGTIAAGAEVTAFIIKAGIEGGITLTVNFYWNDPNNDGKFRFSEFLATALNNPICLFNVGGELDVFLKVFITIGFSPFDFSFDFTLVNVKLLDFSLKPDCTPPPPRLGGVRNHILNIYAGKQGGNTQRGAPWGDGTKDESWVIRENTPDAGQPTKHSITVTGLGISHTFGVNPDNQIDTVVFDGRGYDGGKFNVLFQGATKNQPFDITTIVFGGNKDDTIRVGSGTTFVDGGPGDDSITTTDRPDPGAVDAASAPKATVAGGAGKDVITTGNAQDWVSGDGSLNVSNSSGPADADKYDTTKTDTTDNAVTGAVSLNAALNPSSVGHPSTPTEQSDDGDDLITVGIGGSTVWGGGGNDTIGTSEATTLADAHPGNSKYTPAPNTIVGGDGSDHIASGSASDLIYTGKDKTNTGSDDEGPDDANADASLSTNTVDTGTGSDTVYGSKAEDDVTVHSTHSQSATVYGGGGNDILDGGDGTDAIYGGPGDDYVIAQPATVDKLHTHSDQLGSGAFTVTNLPDNNPAQGKTLVGGGGSDRIFGGDGSSSIWGDHEVYYDATNTTSQGTDACLSPGPARSDPPVEHPNSGVTPGGGNASDPAQQDKGDLIIGGAGQDVIQTGGGDDFVYANGGQDTVCGEGGKDTIDAGEANDTVFGGSGDDTVFGQGGDDSLYGNDDKDTIYGGDGVDTIEGNNHSDTLFGGPGNDTVIGGTSRAGCNDSGDVIYGDTGADRLIGDNGDPDSASGPVFDLGSGNAALGGKDLIYGGDGADHAYGGLADDTIFGGAQNDYLEGNPGADTISGDSGADDIAGGSAQLPGGNPNAVHAVGYPDTGDTISGGAEDDVIIGDNGQITDTASVATGDSVMQGRTLSVGRHVVLYDLGYSPTAGTSGDDTINGDAASDVIYGQGGVDTIHGNGGDDYVEGGQGGDNLFGDDGQDDIAGGSLYVESGTVAAQTAAGQLDTGDTISGGNDADVILGDNGIVDRDTTGPMSDLTRARTDTDAGGGPVVLRRILPFDLQDSPTVNTSGADYIHGNGGSDVILGQGGTDRIVGDADGDYAEGDQGRDWIEGNAGDDDLVGGSSTIKSGTSGDSAQGMLDAGDVVKGGDGDDLITGDNAVTDRSGTPSPYLFRVGTLGALETQRSLRLLDLKNGSNYLTAPPRAVFGGDQLSGGGGVDVIFGQDGPDTISGGANDDYAEGNGDHDVIYGDRTFSDIGLVPADPGWPGSSNNDSESQIPNGQDDLLGGSSTAAFRDGTDDVHGDGAADFILGDNGTAVRNIVAVGANATVLTATQVAAATGALTNQIYAKRYAANNLPADGAFIRHGTSATTPTRFCTTAQATCEPANAYGNDNLWGDAGEDTIYGQDGDDHIYGDTGSLAKTDATAPAQVNDGGGTAGRNDDDLYGELGNDVMYGEFGDDAMVGDRGGIVDQYQSGSNDFVIDNSQVPQIHYEGFISGSVTRQVDLQHDVNGDTFMAGGIMPYRGDTSGGTDRMRGGVGHDSMHGGFGDDLMNGDSGGDILFGDDGADVMWGGKGSDDPNNPNDRGIKDSLVDYLNGGKGATTGPSVDPNNGDLGSDIIDWHPRGTYGSPGAATCTANPWPATGNGKNAVTVDPCEWFRMTDLDDIDVSNNQHHQGIDWMYGGWDRDIMQGDVADNGPNLGDRLLDWTGAYNLYTHCNAAYGGYNDVRQFSPDMQTFLQKWAWSLGAGQASSDVTTSGTSAYDELALVYQPDINSHGSGSAFPSTPGHFDNPNACAP